MAVILGSVIAISLLKGGKGIESFVGIEPCSFWYWFLNFFLIIVSAYILQSYAIDLVEQDNKRSYYGFDFKKFGMIKTTMYNVKMTAFNSAYSGFLGGLLGLGNFLYKSFINFH